MGQKASKQLFGKKAVRKSFFSHHKIGCQVQSRLH